MAEFVVTSTKFSGFMRFAYDSENVLQRFENNATLNMEQLKYVRENFPFALSDLARLKGPNGKIEEDVDITFDSFWKKYNYKVGKVKAQEAWRKLDDGSKFRAVCYIPKYIYDTKLKGHERLYPERYLKYRRFEDE